MGIGAVIVALAAIPFAGLCGATAQVITEFPIPGLPTGNFNGLNGITAGPDGNLWFTESFTGRKIGRITPDGTITEFSTPRIINPFGIVAGPDGNLWFTEYGFEELPGFPDTNLGLVGRITPSGVISEFPIPAGSSYGGDITAGPDGNLWFTEPSRGNAIGRVLLGGVSCPGDCDASCDVTMDEIVSLVNIALGGAQPSGCPRGVPTGSEINSAFIIQAIDNSLSACGSRPDLCRLGIDPKRAQFAVRALRLREVYDSA